MIKITQYRYIVRIYHFLRNLAAVFSIPTINFFRKDKIFVFHHIPKTAGSSLTKMLNKRFILVKESYYTKGIYKGDKVNIRKLRNSNCLTGHFEHPGFQIPDRYPEILEDRRFKLFTFIRDPLQVQISLYFYKNPSMRKELRLTDSILSESNYIAKRIPCNETNYKEILDKYFFIGVTEKIQESVDILFKLMNKKPVKIPTVNVSKKDSQVLEINEEIINEFKRRNALDYKIYNYCLEKYNRIREEVYFK